MSAPMHALEEGIQRTHRNDDSRSFDWLKEFEEVHGRRLRVLHIGNIANNAYNNARIQRRYGIEADVLCFDYYHAMATPEWEDGELTTAVDPALPDWWASNLRGFRRPLWFVQGPLLLCVTYLIARAKRQRFASWSRRCALEVAYWDLLEHRANAVGCKRKVSGRWDFVFRRFLSRLDPWRTPRQALTLPIQSMRNLVLKPLAIAATAKPPQLRGANILIWLWRLQRSVRRLGSNFNRRSLLNGLNEARVIGSITFTSIFTRILRVLGELTVELAVFLALLPVRIFCWKTKIDWKARREADAHAADLIHELRKTEVNVPESVWAELHHYLAATVPICDPMLGHYDVIQGYSIDGMIPFANGFKNYAAYEHGTLRDIPFENTLLGLRCRIAYLNAPVSFVTNSDVLPSAIRMGLSKERLRYLPHAFDETKLLRFREQNPELVPPEDHIRIFSPSRHHWKSGETSWRKGNDVLLRGLARAGARNHNIRLVLVEWGQEVDLSKRLIDELGLSGQVEWVQPMGKRALWQEYCTSHLVADQFVMPALGGVGFEAMALGRRLLSRIDFEQLSEFFGQCPPVLNASSPEEAAAAIAAVLDDPDDRSGVGGDGLKWIQRFHSAERIVDIQASVYRDLLESRNGSGASK